MADELKWRVDILDANERVKDSNEFTATRADASVKAEQYFEARRHKSPTDDWRLLEIQR